MQERNNRNRRSSSMKNARKTRKYSNGSADNPFENYANGRKQSQSTFTKILTLMVIVFLTAIFAILLFANNQEILSKSLGEHSLLSSILSKLSLGNSSKEKPEFALPFGPRRQNILLLGVDSNGADSDLWVGTRTDTMILLNIDPRTKTVNAISIPRDSKVYLPKGMGIQKINQLSIFTKPTLI